MQVGGQQALDRPGVHEGGENGQHDRNTNHPALRVELDDQVNEDRGANSAQKRHVHGATGGLGEDSQ